MAAAEKRSNSFPLLAPLLHIPFIPTCFIGSIYRVAPPFSLDTIESLVATEYCDSAAAGKIIAHSRAMEID